MLSTIESGPSVQVPPSIVLLSVMFHTGMLSVVSASFAGTTSGQNVPFSGLHTSTFITNSLLVKQATLPVSLSDTSVPHYGEAPPIYALMGKML